MKLSYRPEIDGLRGIAILAVMLNHSRENFFKIGFFGVDIFFVLSGFLITKIISKEMENGSFSFLNFYKRRAKRILPALLFVLLTTTFISYFLYTSTDFYYYNNTLVSSFSFLNNIYFARLDGYFNPSSYEKPLQHLWSLSVEEQFYFVFIPIFFLCFKFFKNKTINLVIFLIGLSLASHFLPTFGLDTHYLTYLRAYEILIGSFFALIPNKTLSGKTLFFTLLTIFSLLIIQKNLFPTKGVLEKLIGCISVGLILWNNNKENLVNRFLSWNFLVFIGTIAYPLYLWHWVIFAQIRYTLMESKISLFILIFAISASFILAYLTYRFIENPIRKIKNFSTKHFLCLMILFPILATFSFIYHKLYRNVYSNFSWSNIGVCHSVTDFSSCQKGDLSVEKTILAIGDSKMGHYNPFFDVLGKHEKWSIDIISENMCPIVYNYNKLSESCRLIHEYTLKNIDNYDIIIISQGFSDKIKNIDGYKENFALFLKKLKNKKIYIIEDIYGISSSNHNRYLKLKKYISYPDVHFIDRSKYNEEIKILLESNNINVNWIKLNYLIPKDGTINGVSIYGDSLHLSPYGAEKLAERFIESGAKLIQK